jgi:peptidoglycan/LPS O-acetylase OafA/YrhL
MIVPAQQVAKYSYGIYLAHTPLIWLIFRQLSWLPIAAQWMLFLTSLATVSMACFFLIEAPCIRLGARIAACLRRDPESRSSSVPYQIATTLDPRRINY